MSDFVLSAKASEFFKKSMKGLNWFRFPARKSQQTYEVEDLDDDAFKQSILTRWITKPWQEFWSGIPTEPRVSRSRTPMNNPHHFKFAVTSCLKPDFPYDARGFWAWNWIWSSFDLDSSYRNRIKGFEFMQEELPYGLRFLVFLGDFIYSDVPIYTGAKAETYRRLYRTVFRSVDFRKILAKVPIFSIYDDHEIINNFAGESSDNQTDISTSLMQKKTIFKSASIAFDEYLGNGNPTPLEPGEHYYTFRYGDSAFFVMDTRRHRSAENMTDGPQKTMLGSIQLLHLLEWLKVSNETATFKFVVSSVPFNSLWAGPDGQADTWAGYLHERDIIMDVMENVSNVIVLSGVR